jgi:ABC-2 type transport system permease protein
VAGVLTGHSGGSTSGEAIWRTIGVLIGMRRSLARNSPGGWGTVLALRFAGLLVAVGTLLLGLVRLDPDRSVDLLAALILGWLVGWVMGPIMVRGAAQGLRPEWFALLPVPPRRLAAGLLGASFAGVAAALTLVAFAALPVAASRFGLLPVLVAVPATLLELLVVVLLSRVVVAAMIGLLSTRRGQELGGLLLAVVIAIASGGWSLAWLMGQQLAQGAGPVLSTTLRVLPSGWGPVAVAAAGRSDWLLALGPLLGLAVLAVLLVLAWAWLLPRIMRQPTGHTPWIARRRAASRRPALVGVPSQLPATPRQPPAAWHRLLPGGPTRAVVVKELRGWRRDPGRVLLLLLAVLISGVNLAVPAVIFHGPAALPWVGLAAALIVGMGTANVYGDDGTALWLTRMTPGTERADVRGRQAAWLLVVAPATVALTVAVTALVGQGWAWPWILATLPAVLGGTAGLTVWISAARPIREKDPQRRTSPFDTSDDPIAAGALVGGQYLMLLLAALTAVPAGAVVLAGAAWHQPVLQAAGVLAGIATGVLLYWWGGRAAARRLAGRGAELMDLLNLGPQARSPQAGSPQARRARGFRDWLRPAREPGVPLRRGKAALRGALLTVGILCIVPQGLVPIGFNLLGVDQQVKVWFAARYLEQDLQAPAAAAFIAVGLLAILFAGTISRSR